MSERAQDDGRRHVDASRSTRSLPRLLRGALAVLIRPREAAALAARDDLAARSRYVIETLEPRLLPSAGAGPESVVPIDDPAGDAVGVVSTNTPPVAVDDTDTTDTGVAVVIDLTGNDTDADGDGITILDIEVPANGTVVDNGDGTVTYTPDDGFAGVDTFDYVITDGNSGLTAFWNLDGDAEDSVGLNDGTVTGTTTVPGVFGSGLDFDEVDDYIILDDFDYGPEFTLSFWFMVDGIDGDQSQVVFSHGKQSNRHSLNIVLGEGSSPFSGLLMTRLFDDDDALNSGIDVDVNSLVGDGDWHLYTLTVETGTGYSVYIDGVLEGSDPRGGGAFDPDTDIYIGAREDLNPTRYFSGALDGVQLYGRPLDATEVAALSTGGTSRGTVTVTVLNNQAPVLATNAGLTVAEGAAGTISTTELEVTDADSAADELVFTVGTTPANGTLRLSGVALGTTDTFTQEDVDNNLLTYTHDGGETASDSFTFTVSDGDGGTIGSTTFTLTVTAVNDDPVLAMNSGRSVAQGGTATIAQGVLEVTDADNTPGEITFTVGTAPANGTLRLSGVALGTSDTFTQADIDAGLVTYLHDNSPTGSDSFTFTVSDGAGGAIGLTSFSIMVNAVNQAPVLATNAGLTVNEGATGTLSATELEVTDVDNAATELVFTLTAAPSNGTLRLSGVALGATDSFTQDDIDNGCVTYAHDGGETTSDSFTFTVSDGAGGSIGATVFAITVNAVNDDPVLAANAGLTVVEGAAGTISAAELEFTDAESAATAVTFTLIAAPSNGTLRLSGVAIAATDTFTQDDIDNGLLTYTHDGGETTGDSFTFTVSDGTGGSIGATAFALTVTPVNDVPVLATNAGLTLGASTAAVITTALLEVTDVDTAAAALTYTLTVAPAEGALRRAGVALGVSDTFTQADIDAGIVTYVNGGGEATSDSFTFTVSDGAGGSIGATSFAFTVTQPAAPVLAVNAGLTLAEGATSTITAALLAATDVESTADELTYLLTAAPQVGVLRVSGFALGAGDSFTQADIDANIVTYTHDDGGATSDSFEFTLLDDDSGTPVDATFAITITQVNDVPIVVTNLGATLEESESVTISDALLEVADEESADDAIVFELTAVPALGTLSVGGTPLALGDSFTQEDIRNALVRYEHDETSSLDAGLSYPLRDAFSVTVRDGDGGSVDLTFRFVVEKGADSGGEAPTPPPPVPETPPPPAPGPDGEEDGGGEDGTGEENSPNPESEPPPPADTEDEGGPVSPTDDPDVVLPRLILFEADTAPAQAAAVRPAAAIAPTEKAAVTSVAPTVTVQETTIDVQLVTDARTAFSSEAGSLWKDLDSLEERLQSGVKVKVFLAGTAAFVTMSLSVTYVLWLLRAGFLLSSVLSSLPAWRWIDPLPILSSMDAVGDDASGDDEDDESLEGMIERSGRESTAT